MGNDQPLYVSTGDGDNLHVDEDCRQLSNARDTREARADERRRLDQCKRCDPRYDVPNPTGYGHMRSLLEAAREDAV